MSRFQEWLRQTPPATLCFAGVCVIIHLIGQVILGWNLHRFTLCPRLVINGQIYRIVTGALFHGSFMHIGMNMLTLVGLGVLLEKRMGTFRTAFVCWFSILLTGTLHTGTAWILASLFHIRQPYFQHSVGFSGVLFHLSVLECNHNGSAPRSLFGIVQVPSYVYPWVLLGVIQVIMPGISFMGHLSGIIVGTLHIHGYLQRFFPGESTFARTDNLEVLSFIRNLPSFCPTTSNDGVLAHSGGRTIGGVASSRCSRIRVAIFGNGPEANSNVSLPTWLVSGPTITHTYGPLEPTDDTEQAIVGEKPGSCADEHESEMV